jgi:Kef-type K+ transport system membrane component KefB
MELLVLAKMAGVVLVLGGFVVGILLQLTFGYSEKEW